MLYFVFLGSCFAARSCWSPDSPYTGTKNTLKNWTKCQSWSNSFPHTVAHYPKTESYNYCRNPDNDPAGPWCYSSDFTAPEYLKYSYCDIPKCLNFKKKKVKRNRCTSSSYYYRGDITTTESGKTCLNWNEVEDSTKFPRFIKMGIPSDNKCRNPNKDGDGAWCYTIENVWKPYFHKKLVKEKCPVSKTDKYNKCPVGCLEDPLGSSYTGKASVTQIGYVCQKWTTNYPNKPYVTPNEADIDHNFCRNPNNDPNGPWCYVFSYSFTKAYCSQIPYCPGVVASKPETTTEPVTATKYTKPTQPTKPTEGNQTTKPETAVTSVTCGHPYFPLSRSIIRQTTDLSPRYVRPYLRTSREVQRQDRIYGGDEAAAGTVPWIVSFVFGDPKDNKSRCGGSIIGAHFVLTAAHCALDQKVENVRITAGVLSESGVEKQAVELKVKKIIVHPNYGQGNADDIALIQIEKIESWPRMIRPICLPKARDRFIPGNMCLIAGWGATEDQNVSTYLKQTIVPKLPLDVCKRWSLSSIDHQKEFCAGWEEGGKDSCTGDSGGPFMCRVGTTWKLFGIVSWGNGCARANSPGVYVNVQHYLQWIRRTTSSILKHE